MSARPADTRRPRRLWPLIVLALVLGVVLWFGRYRAVEVEAEYALLEARSDLVALHVRWSGHDNGKVVEKSFHYGAHRSAPRYEAQTLELPPDTYTVTLQIERGDGTSERIEHEIEIREATSVELRAPELSR